MHFGDSIFIFVLALVLFGPKKLPEIGRQLGKLMAEFRRASNEFKLQIEEELRAAEEEERRKKLAAQSQAPAALPQPETDPVTAQASLPGGDHPLTIQPPTTGAPVSAAAPDYTASTALYATTPEGNGGAGANGAAPEEKPLTDAYGYPVEPHPDELYPSELYPETAMLAEPQPSSSNTASTEEKDQAPLRHG